MDIFSKLNTLKSIEPNEGWVVDAKKRVLSEAPASEKKRNILENIKSVLLGLVHIEKLTVAMDSRLRGNDIKLSFQKMAVPAFALVFMLSTGVFTVGASRSSSPGEFLYSLKMINEDVVLAIAPENKKAEIEMEQAGKRLEEMAVISKNTSDVEQQKKMGQLMERFEEKINNANSRLASSSGNGEKAKVAKAINTQSKKYTEVLAKTTEELPVIVQDEILEEVEKAVASSEKIYLTSLAAMVEGMTDEDIEEITAMVKEKVGEKENEEEGVVANEENTEDIKKALLEDLDNLNNPEGDGEVLGDEDCVCEVDTGCVCEEEIAEEGLGEDGNISEEETNSNL